MNQFHVTLPTHRQGICVTSGPIPVRVAYTIRKKALARHAQDRSGRYDLHTTSVPDPEFLNPQQRQVIFCTMFDCGYLARGLALIHSLRTHGVREAVWVLALDDETRRYLEMLALPEVRVVSVTELEDATSGLAACRPTRSRVEYYFTCTPALVRYALSAADGAGWAVYLDSDMWFFRSPDHVFRAASNADVGIVAHRFPEELKSLRQYGNFNVAWVMFRASNAGRACAEWWSAQCIEWCYDRVEDGKYADQGYLDQFSSLFPGTQVLDDPGLNVAPWNLRRHSFHEDDEIVRVDGEPLTFFHFHGLRRRGDWFYPNLATYRTRMTPTVRNRIYLPYVDGLRAAEDGLLGINFGHPVPRLAAPPATRNRRSLRSAAYRARRRYVQISERLNGTAIRVFDDTSDKTPERGYVSRGTWDKGQ